jgi:hypothetical protein
VELYQQTTDAGLVQSQLGYRTHAEELAEEIRCRWRRKSALTEPSAQHLAREGGSSDAQASDAAVAEDAKAWRPPDTEQAAEAARLVSLASHDP